MCAGLGRLCRAARAIQHGHPTEIAVLLDDALFYYPRNRTARGLPSACRTEPRRVELAPSRPIDAPWEFGQPGSARLDMNLSDRSRSRILAKTMRPDANEYLGMSADCQAWRCEMGILDTLLHNPGMRTPGLILFICVGIPVVGWTIVAVEALVGKHRERVAMIEQGIDPDLRSKVAGN